MKAEKGRYTAAYECYKTRIRFGYYKYGDTLPPLRELSELFHIAPSTAHSALAALESEGDISLRANKAAKVIYLADTGTYEQAAATYFLQREKGIQDIFKSSSLMFNTFWNQQLKSLSNEEWNAFLKILERPRPGAASVHAQLYLYILSRLDNHLIQDLYWEMVRYIRYPYMVQVGSDLTERQNLEQMSKEEATALLKQEHEIEREIQELLGFIRGAYEKCGLDKVEPVDFHWCIDRPHSQQRYTLVSRIICGIVAGQYPAGSYLPPNSKLAEQYGVGVNTIRRTIKILNSLGVSSSHQGKGTLIRLIPDLIDLTLPEIKNGIRYFYESLQLMDMILPQTLNLTLRSVNPEILDGLTRKFRDLQEMKQCYLCFKVILIFIEEYCPLMTIRECCRELRDLLAWGYPLAMQYLDEEGLHEKYIASAIQSANLIEVNDLSGFSEYWGQMVRQEMERTMPLIEAE